MVAKRQIKQSPKLPPEERRRQLLRAAHKLFLKKGYGGTTVDEIARAVGLTKGALYFHFHNKEDILFEMVRNYTEHHEAALDGRATGKQSPADLFRVHLESQFGTCDCDFAEIVDIWIQAWRIPRIKRYIATRARKRIQKEAASLDPKTLPKGTSAESMAILISSAVHGLASLRLVSPSMIDLKAQKELVDQIFPTKQKKKSK
jgi:AcrR family transcriptional regulator